ncbi:MAG: universal stress protein [Nitrospirae bacterium]|jgi:nucleotide-binding universal stress UspA family protein|nr:universal stress protein [Nitrospirota bacterium]
MNIYRKILIAIDGSKTSMHALKEFVNFSKSYNPDITIISVIPPYDGDLNALWVDNIDSSIKRQCDTALSDALKIAKDADVSVSAVCEEGEIHERIVDFADSGNYDLIVMGKKGMSLIEKAFVGSVTSRVIGYSRQDVLVIPFESKLSWDNILIATDGSAYSEVAAMRAIEIARKYKSKIKILSVVDVTVEFMIRAQEVYNSLVEKAKDITNDIKARAFSLGVGAEPVVRDGEVHRVILDVANEYKINMIVMGRLGKSGIKRLLMGSTTERVLGHTTCPVLIVKP